jgi:hypothetical protein
LDSSFQAVNLDDVVPQNGSCYIKGEKNEIQNVNRNLGFIIQHPNWRFLRQLLDIKEKSQRTTCSQQRTICSQKDQSLRLS